MTRKTDPLLGAWREAHRALVAVSPDDPSRPEALARVATTWLAYQVAAGGFDEEEVVVVFDDDGRYLAVTDNVERVFGLDADAIVGRRPADLDVRSARDAADGLRRLLRLGSLEGTYIARPPADAVRVGFVARANAPIPGLHVARHRVVGPGEDGDPDGATRHRPDASPTSWWDAGRSLSVTSAVA